MQAGDIYLEHANTTFISTKSSYILSAPPFMISSPDCFKNISEHRKPPYFNPVLPGTLPIYLDCCKGIVYSVRFLYLLNFKFSYHTICAKMEAVTKKKHIFC